MGPSDRGPLPRDGSVATPQTLGWLALVAVLLVSVTAAPGAAQADPADTSFVVALQPSGDATVTLRLTFDVSAERDREALQRLRENRSAVVSEFGDGMAAVAAGASAETGRAMSVSEPTMRVTTEGDRGLVELSVDWRGLAAVDGDRLRVTAPFDDGFRPPGRLVLRAPSGYAVEAAEPAPTATSGREAAWAAGTALDGFTASVAPAPADGASQPMPGFGVPAALLALALVAGIAAVARRHRP